MSAVKPALSPTGAPIRDQSSELFGELLHALNQPLTGLQCFLELSISRVGSESDYIDTIREGLKLTGRMRVLVTALRDLSEFEQSATQPETLMLNDCLRDTAHDLFPVAEMRGVDLQVEAAEPLAMCADNRQLSALMFRFLESALSLTERGQSMRVSVVRDGNVANLSLSWVQNGVPDDSPFSIPEIGLLLSSHGWKRLGGKCTNTRAERLHTRTVRISLLTSRNGSRNGESK